MRVPTEMQFSLICSLIGEAKAALEQAIEQLDAAPLGEPLSDEDRAVIVEALRFSANEYSDSALTTKIADGIKHGRLIVTVRHA